MTKNKLAIKSSVKITKVDKTSYNYDITKMEFVTKRDGISKVAKNNAMPKPLSDICAETNMFFYHNVEVLNDKTLIVDNMFMENPQDFVEDFIYYENTQFTKYRQNNLYKI